MRGGPALSYLAFADDVILFAEASEEQILLIKNTLNLFCRCSGQKISDSKSRIFFSNNVSGNTRNLFTQASGFQVTNNLGKYLGVPILHEKVNRRSFQFILDKVDQRLSNWKAKTLSFAGRLTLTKSVVQALPTYVMQSVELPKYLCAEIDKKCRKFLWGDMEGDRHMHTVSWSKVCSPKSWGGLGLRAAHKINQASMVKVGWQLATKKEDLWVKVIRAKYKCGSDLLPRIGKDKPGSNLWKGICHTWDHVEKNLVWRLGDGATINVWRDNWLPSVGPLSSFVHHSPSMVEAALRVKDLVNFQGEWVVGRISSFVPDAVIQIILKLSPPSQVNGSDRIA